MAARTLDNVDRWDAPDADTFVIHMKKVQPTFIEALASFSVPIVIIPAEDKDDPAAAADTADRHRAVAAGASSCPAAS